MAAIQIHENDYVAIISEKMKSITGEECGIPVYLDGVTFSEKSNSRSGRGKITVSCIFNNNDGLLCADIFRMGTGGCSEIFSGALVSELEDTGLSRILFALENKNWTSSAVNI